MICLLSPRYCLSARAADYYAAQAQQHIRVRVFVTSSSIDCYKSALFNLDFASQIADSRNTRWAHRPWQKAAYMLHISSDNETRWYCTPPIWHLHSRTIKENILLARKSRMKMGGKISGASGKCPSRLREISSAAVCREILSSFFSYYMTDTYMWILCARGVRTSLDGIYRDVYK